MIRIDRLQVCLLLLLLLSSTQFLRNVGYERIALRLLSKLADLVTGHSVQQLIPVVVISFLVLRTRPTNGCFVFLHLPMPPLVLLAAMLGVCSPRVPGSRFRCPTSL
uniref:Putative secreted protein n=1 Tax=Ixodes ricinus TaxID=34613 RepID=A0A6B0UHR3_IXORI